MYENIYNPDRLLFFISYLFYLIHFYSIFLFIFCVIFFCSLVNFAKQNKKKKHIVTHYFILFFSSYVLFIYSDDYF